VIFYLAIFDLTGTCLFPSFLPNYKLLHRSNIFFLLLTWFFFFLYFRRTGVANTLRKLILFEWNFQSYLVFFKDIAIEKCYEQLNYIRDSYAEVNIRDFGYTFFTWSFTNSWKKSQNWGDRKFANKTSSSALFTVFYSDFLFRRSAGIHAG